MNTAEQEFLKELYNKLWKSAYKLRKSTTVDWQVRESQIEDHVDIRPTRQQKPLSLYSSKLKHSQTPGVSNRIDKLRQSQWLSQTKSEQI